MLGRAWPPRFARLSAAPLAPPHTTTRAQVSRLKRELDALEEARARSREEAQRAEQARMALEVELKVWGGGHGRGCALQSQRSAPKQDWQLH